MSGGGLNWSLVKRVNAQGGTTEMWTAQSSGPVSSVQVSSTQTRPSYNQSLTVVAFSGAKGTGASATANASTGAPSVSITPTAAGSVIYGAGNDYDRAVSRTAGTGQAMVHEWLDTAIGDSYWVQRRTASPAAGSPVTISDTALTNDRWNLAALEILAR